MSPEWQNVAMQFMKLKKAVKETAEFLEDLGLNDAYSNEEKAIFLNAAQYLKEAAADQ